MIGAFIGYGVLHALGGPLSPNVALAPLIVLMFLAAMLASGLLGVVIERFAYRPLRDAPRIAPLISALGVSFFLQNSALLLFGAQFRSYDSFVLGSKNPELFEPGPLTDPVFVVKNVNIQLIQIIVLRDQCRADGRADRLVATDADRQGDARDVATTARPRR